MWQRKVRFRINETAAERAGLRIRSRLLDPAEVVRQSSERARQGAAITKQIHGLSAARVKYASLRFVLARRSSTCFTASVHRTIRAWLCAAVSDGNSAPSRRRAHERSGLGSCARRHAESTTLHAVHGLDVAFLDPRLEGMERKWMPPFIAEIVDGGGTRARPIG